VGEAGKDGGQEVRWYGEPLLYVILIAAAKEKNPCVFPGRELNWESLVMADRGVNKRAMRHTLMLETVPVV
jgi:hypothetical protein